MDLIKTLFGLLWKVIVFAQQLILTMLAIVVIFVFITVGSLNRVDETPSVLDGSALVIAPTGVIVEELSDPDTAALLLMDEDTQPLETRLSDILTAIHRAKSDDRIEGLVIFTDGMAGAGPSKLHEIAKEIRNFKESEKPVYAVSTAYSQGDYLLASQADKIFMNKAGNVILQGYGGNVSYYKGLLDKLKVEMNIFRVGTYKSAVEPYIREDMSPAAKEARRGFLGELWSQYDTEVTTARGLEPGSLTSNANNFLESLRASDGNFAQLALDTKLVDELASRGEWRQALINEFGKSFSGRSFKQMNFRDYVEATNSEVSDNNGDGTIAVITVQGEIVMGRGDAAIAAAETIVEHIRRARNNWRTKAIILRVDSPGGSAFGSELIRQELVMAQNQGIPVVASFSTLAASGGYWISATSNKIIAAPSTITGSIGIFGIIPTFEDTLAEIGVTHDGVGTTDLATAFDVTKSMSPTAKGIFQQVVDNGYAEFLNLVANGRNMRVADVAKIAEGRVWAGSTALEHGLVDELGYFDDAVRAAAELAELEDYKVVYYREAPDALTQLLADLRRATFATAETDIDGMIAMSPFAKVAEQMKRDAKLLMRFNDPTGKYALCEACGVR